MHLQGIKYLHSNSFFTNNSVSASWNKFLDRDFNVILITFLRKVDKLVKQQIFNTQSTGRCEMKLFYDL